MEGSLETALSHLKILSYLESGAIFEVLLASAVPSWSHLGPSWTLSPQSLKPLAERPVQVQGGGGVWKRKLPGSLEHLRSTGLAGLHTTYCVLRIPYFIPPGTLGGESGTGGGL